MKLFSAIAIVAVVIGHLRLASTGLEGPFNLLPPYAYQVAAFVFVSGYFFNQEKALSHPCHYLAHKFKRLIIPLLLINAVYGLIIAALQRKGFTLGVPLTLESVLLDPIVFGTQFRINLAMWFLAPLFFAELVNVIVCALLSRLPSLLQEAILLVLYMSLGVYTVGVGALQPGPILLICRTSFFLSCFALGRFYRQVLEKHDTMRTLPFLLIVCTAQLTLTYLAGHVVTYESCYNTFPDGAVLTYASTIVSLAFLLRVCKVLGPTIGKTRTVLALANNSFSIMCHHLAGCMCLSGIFFLLAQTGIICQNFDVGAFMSNVYYLYLPHGLTAFALVYVVFCIAFSLFVHGVWSGLQAGARKLLHTRIR